MKDGAWILAFAIVAGFLIWTMAKSASRTVPPVGPGYVKDAEPISGEESKQDSLEGDGLSGENDRMIKGEKPSWMVN